MEEFIKSGGVAGLLAAITVMLALQLVAKIAEFLWSQREKKDTVTESCIDKLSAAVDLNTAAAEKLEGRIGILEMTIGDITKFRADTQKLFHAVKLIAGDRWPEIRSQVIEEDRMV